MGDAPVCHMLLEAARADAKALRVLIGLPEISDSIVGFHAQQAVEKALKSVLSSRGVAFRRTHDIAELLDLLADRHLPAPPHADVLDELNPFAVEARYGLIARYARTRQTHRKNRSSSRMGRRGVGSPHPLIAGARRRPPLAEDLRN